MLTVLVPTRGRPHVVRDVIEAVGSTRSREDTELWFGVDKTDPELVRYHDAFEYAPGANDWVHMVPTQSTTMVECLNQLALTVLSRPITGLTADLRPSVALMFMGDDHRPRTPGWDAELLKVATGQYPWAPGPGIAYGNDLLQGQNLPTQVAIDARIVDVLGAMAPPQLTHLYLDNYWKTLGQMADCLRYLPDVVIEHMHPVAGKAEMDEGYARVNSGDMYARDHEAYAEMLSNDVIHSQVRAIDALRERVRAGG